MVSANGIRVDLNSLSLSLSLSLSKGAYIRR